MLILKICQVTGNARPSPATGPVLGSRRGRRRWIPAVLFIPACLPGCATTPTHQDLSAFLKSHESEVSALESRVGAGDTLSIVAPRVLEIDGERQHVQPDGTITLRLLGDVKVVDLTAREIDHKLEELLQPYYHEPQVSVRIESQPQRVYYVMGHVGTPGPLPYTGRDTVLHALAVAQPTHIGWKSRVKVLRPNPDESQRRTLEVDADAMVESGDTRLNVLLEPGDVVYVPPTPLGWLGLQVHALLFPITPIAQTYQTPAALLATQDYYDDRGRRDR